MNLLFVCASNVCRSPYCEYLFRRMAEEDPLPGQDLAVRTSAVINHRKEMDPKTKAALIREGFSPEQCDAHRPGWQPLDREKFREADVIIGMTKAQKWFLFPAWRKKFVTLSEAATGSYTPIPDPWLIKDMDEYFAVMDEIKGYLTRYYEKLRAENAGN